MAFLSQQFPNLPMQTPMLHENSYFLVRWRDDGNFDIVAENDIQEGSNSVRLFRETAINLKGRKRQGTAIAKGTIDDCKMLHESVTPPAQNVATKGMNRNTWSHTYSDDEDSNTQSTATSFGWNEGDENSFQPRKQASLELLPMRPQKSHANKSCESHQVKCHGCGDYSIRGDRYRCLQCNNIDLCSDCFEHRREVKQHRSGHLMAHFRLANDLFGRYVADGDVNIHKLKQIYGTKANDVNCDGCKAVNFFGLRFKCDSCHDYDLCEHCALSGVTTGSHKLSHPLILSFKRNIVQIPESDIERLEKLGSGAFGSVYKGVWKPKSLLIACKVIEVPDTKEAQVIGKSFYQELAAYSELSGGYILKTYGYAVSRQNSKKTYMIISEYMPRGSLSNVLTDKKKLSLRRKVRMAREIASGMRKIHEHHMIHRDIRPDNILVDEDYTCKIGDMGIARVKDPLKRHTLIGCQHFMPPEFFSGSYDEKLDIFTFGLTLNELLTETQHNFRPFINDKISLRAESPVFKSLITRCTANDPRLRPTANEIERTLELYVDTFDSNVFHKGSPYKYQTAERKDESFILFCEQFRATATDILNKEFPARFLARASDIQGVQVKTDLDDDKNIICPLQ